MSEKRFTSEDYGSDYYTEIVDNKKQLDHTLYNPSQRLNITEAVDLLNEQDDEISQLNEENFKLKQALLSYFDISVSDWATTYDKHMEIGCKVLFGCSHDEAKEKYGGFEKTEKYRELENAYWELEKEY